jgi:Ca2+-binding RTX toxin-like protein
VRWRHERGQRERGEGETGAIGQRYTERSGVSRMVGARARPQGRTMPLLLTPRSFFLLLATSAALLAIPCSAQAIVLISYNATSGLTVSGDTADNTVQIEVTPADHYTVNVPTGGAATFSGCTTQDSQVFDCAITGTRAIGATMGAGKDGLNLLGAAAAFGPATVDLGDGDDNLRAEGSSGPVTADGGAGDDTFRGTGGSDLLRGGADEDDFFGQAGADTMLGGDGSDTFHASARHNVSGPSDATEETAPAPDVMDGDAGVDRIDYVFTSEHVSVSLDGVANDGRDGEGDNVIDMENVVGGRTSNTITGDAQANRLSVSICCTGAETPPGGDDVIHGGGGADVIGGGRGNDQLFGDDGNDTIWGGGNSDTIDGGKGTDDLRDGGQPGVTIPGGPNPGVDPSQQLGPQGTVEPGDDTLLGGDDADVISARDGTDVAHGGGDNDTIALAGTTSAPGAAAFGDDGVDDITGSGGPVSVKVDGGPGNDKLQTAANSTILGGTGDDTIRNVSGSGKDTIDGGSGNDTVESGNGDDTVIGGSGNDVLGNLAGSDTINGGQGDDSVFVRQTPASTDTVDCGTGPRTDDKPDNDSVNMNLVDTQVHCENQSTSPAGEVPNVTVPRAVVRVPAGGRIPVKVTCLRRADRGGCTGTIQLGVISREGRAGGLGPKLTFRIRRLASKTLLVPVRGADRARLLGGGGGARVRIVILQPGKKGRHTTVRARGVRRR